MRVFWVLFALSGLLSTSAFPQKDGSAGGNTGLNLGLDFLEPMKKQPFQDELLKLLEEVPIPAPLRNEMTRDIRNVEALLSRQDITVSDLLTKTRMALTSMKITTHKDSDGKVTGSSREEFFEIIETAGAFGFHYIPAELDPKNYVGMHVDPETPVVAYTQNKPKRVIYFKGQVKKLEKESPAELKRIVLEESLHRISYLGKSRRDELEVYSFSRRLLEYLYTYGELGEDEKKQAEREFFDFLDGREYRTLESHGFKESEIEVVSQDYIKAEIKIPLSPKSIIQVYLTENHLCIDLDKETGIFEKWPLLRLRPYVQPICFFIDETWAAQTQKLKLRTQGLDRDFKMPLEVYFYEKTKGKDSEGLRIVEFSLAKVKPNFSETLKELDAELTKIIEPDLGKSVSAVVPGLFFLFPDLRENLVRQFESLKLAVERLKVEDPAIYKTFLRIGRVIKVTASSSQPKFSYDGDSWNRPLRFTYPPFEKDPIPTEWWLERIRAIVTNSDIIESNADLFKARVKQVQEKLCCLKFTGSNHLYARVILNDQRFGKFLGAIDTFMAALKRFAVEDPEFSEAIHSLYEKVGFYPGFEMQSELHREEPEIRYFFLKEDLESGRLTEEYFLSAFDVSEKFRKLLLDKYRKLKRQQELEKWLKEEVGVKFTVDLESVSLLEQVRDLLEWQRMKFPKRMKSFQQALKKIDPKLNLHVQLRIFRVQKNLGDYTKDRRIEFKGGDFTDYEAEVFIGIPIDEFEVRPHELMNFLNYFFSRSILEYSIRNKYEWIDHRSYYSSYDTHSYMGFENKESKEIYKDALSKMGSARKR